MIIKMSSDSLSKELLEWFNYAEDTVSVSAFVQQRSKIKYDAWNFIFKTITRWWDKHLLFKGYQLIAVDSSNFRLPLSKENAFSLIRNTEEMKGYNLC